MQTRESFHPFCIVLCLLVCGSTWAVEFAGGTGEPNDPYQIATAEQLVAISSDQSLYDKHFLLTADIDLDPNLPGGRVFQGTVLQWYSPSTRAGRDGLFHGSFNGGGHAIRNAVLFRTEYVASAGFFGQIAQEAVVRDLHLENVLIVEQSNSGSEGSYCAALAAVNYGTVIDCSATGIITGDQSAGLIGRNVGVVADCQVDCSVFGGLVGGLIRINDATGRVVLCRSGGVAYGDRQTGGLVAMNMGTIQYCTAAGYVSGVVAGGLVYENYGTIRESFASATVVGGQYGGIASNNSGTIVNCYATQLGFGQYGDGLVGANKGTILSSYGTTASQPRPSRTVPMRSPGVSATAAAEQVVRYVYYLDATKSEGQTDSPYDGYGVALSPAEMEQAGSFVGFDFYTDDNDGPMGHWFMPADGYPILTWQTEITGLIGVPDLSGLRPDQAELLLEAVGLKSNGVTHDYARPQVISSHGMPLEVDTKGQVIAGQPVGYISPTTRVEIVVSLGKYDFHKNPGDGSEANPFQIGTAGQLDSLFGQNIVLHYILTADIDLSAYSYPDSLVRWVTGEFNGNGHTIRGLQIAVSDAFGNEYGLFSRVGPTGSIHDLIVEQASVCAVRQGAIGILVGDNQGRLLRCEAAGQVLGGWIGVGGLAGQNNSDGQLTDCRFRGRVRTISNSSDVGGLVGYNMGVILRCGACDVDVSGDYCVGGLAGQSGSSTGAVEACYAIGAVQGVNCVGGLLGQNGIPPAKPKLRPVLVEAEIAVAAEPAANGMIHDCYAACLVTGQQNVGGCIGAADVAEAVQQSCYFLDPRDGGGPDNGLGTHLTAWLMKQQARFPDWDFVDTWTICEGKDYPRLRWEGVQCGQ